MTITIPPVPVSVPELEASSSCSAVGDSVLAAAKDARAVADSAGDGAQSLTWEGVAADAADHAMTVLTNEIGDAVSALWGVVQELDAYAETITDLETRHADLVTLRSSLVTDRDALIADAAAVGEDEVSLWLQLRASTLTLSISTFAQTVETWSTELTTAEDAVIAALQAGDTAAEARDFREARPPELQASIDALVDAGVLPEAMRYASAADLQAWLTDNPEAAAGLVDGTAPLTGSAAVLNQLVNGAMMTNPGADVSAIRMQGVHDFFADLDPESAALLATLYPSLVGSTDGAPFDARELANRVKVIDALADERELLEGMEDRHEHHQGDWDLFGRNNDDLEGPLADTRDRIALYESILNDDRTILFFEPATHDSDFNRTYDGGIAELHGEITADTQNVGTLVPGTGSHLGNYDGNASRSESFHNAAPDRLAMITWMGGDLPDSLLDAKGDEWSRDLGPKLAGFSDAVRLEIESSGSSASTTYAGHSYGGAVVGRAEAAGLDADRVLHIASAGMGNDIGGPSDYPDSQNDVHRYSMTAPGDPIENFQGLDAGSWGHGADPDTFPGTERLHTGNDAGPDGAPLQGSSAHSDVFNHESDSWNQMLEVFVGGEVETYRTPTYDGPVTYPSSRGPVYNWNRSVDGWNDDGSTIDVEG
ncbi:hypothetical protein C8046_11810 [Serinibacter arcticus]|uniref:DUF1023 domain-containing protein n=1 Tax=Serinibacter arcticus TaxID=1655435 RepID=A0A2U1ZW67_9MICO|nr:alpha/beta hydrolase [Serinibacter arcticus]PWD51237.1 hypothetical protein C8046_11810 [Serinibacter arcticus]